MGIKTGDDPPTARQADPPGHALHVWWTAGSIILVAALLAVSITALRGHADDARKVQLIVAELNGAAHELSRVEWEAAAKRHVAPQLVTESRVISDRITDLVRAHPGGGHRLHLESTRYLRAVKKQLALLDAGRATESRRVDEREVDPSFDRLLAQLRLLDAAQSKSARTAAVQADLGITLTLMLAALMMIVMLRRLDRVRSTASRRREEGREAQAVAERVNGDLAHQRTRLINAQAVGQFGSWEWDIATDSTLWSGELWRAHGLNPSGEAMSFEDFVDSVHPDDRALVRAQIQAAFESGDAFDFDHRIVRSDGVVRVIHARGEVVMKPDGTPAMMRGTGQDITERREVERSKDEFISIVSHELRTPLTSIRGSLGLLASGELGPLPDKGRRMVQIAVQNTDRLVRLINDILDVERIDAGTIDMHQQPCDALELVQRAIQGVEQFAADVHVTLSAAGDSVALSADPDRVVQTLTNLISNAVKFSPHGSTVRVSCVRSLDDVLFAVADDGKGIPADKLASIFERFQQVDASDSREKGGTGLGLAICRKIVERHGGRIWVDSELAGGSVFSFALPAATA